MGQSIKQIVALCIIIFRGALQKARHYLNKKLLDAKPGTMEYYLYKIARLTGKSEYEVFCKSAESWPITKEKIEQDFSVYLSQNTVPYYVTDFIRKNKKHIDELHIPLF
jgi:hypothetical protein